MHVRVAMRIKLVGFRIRISWTVLHNSVILYVFIESGLNLHSLNAIHCIQHTLLSDPRRCLSLFFLQVLRGIVTISYLLLSLTGIAVTTGLLTVCDLALAEWHCFFGLK
jgi:hypothetical protein